MAAQLGGNRFRPGISKFGQLVKNVVEDLECFGDGARNYKVLCSRVRYFVKRSRFGEWSCQQVRSGIRQCMNLFKIIVQSTEYQKYGHQFSPIQTLLKNYQCPTSTKAQPNPTPTSPPIPHLPSPILNLHQISPHQLKFLQQQNLNPFLTTLQNSQTVLQDPSCICCTQVLIKNFKIVNRNPMVGVVVELGEKKGLDFVGLEGVLNGVCNQGGGVVVIGMGRKNGENVVKGIMFRMVEEIVARQAEIKMAISRIRPACHYLIERVLVHTNYVNPQNVSQENMRICFRILIFPKQLNKVTYSQIQNKNNHKIYETMKLDHEKTPYKVITSFSSPSPSTPSTPSTSTSLQPTNYESLYTFIHQKYQQNKQNANSHKNIGCFRPYSHYSYYFNEYVKRGCPVQPVEIEEDEECNNQEVLTDQPKLKYKHTSLIIFGSKKGDRFIKDLENILKEKKQIFQISRPFQKSFRDGIRSIWMISHQMNFIELKAFFKGLQLRSILKPGCLISMPVYHTLQIQKSKFNEARQQIQQKYLSRYPQLFDTETAEITENNKLKTVTYLHFSSVNQAMFTYMIFQELQLRPYFTKDGNNTNIKY